MKHFVWLPIKPLWEKWLFKQGKISCIWDRLEIPLLSLTRSADEGCSQGSEQRQVNYKQDSLNGHQQLRVIALQAEVGRGRDIGAILHLLLWSKTSQQPLMLWQWEHSMNLIYKWFYLINWNKTKHFRLHLSTKRIWARKMKTERLKEILTEAKDCDSSSSWRSQKDVPNSNVVCFCEAVITPYCFLGCENFC